jgi:hypothetical protein
MSSCINILRENGVKSGKEKTFFKYLLEKVTWVEMIIALWIVGIFSTLFIGVFYLNITVIILAAVIAFLGPIVCVIHCIKTDYNEWKN